MSSVGSEWTERRAKRVRVLVAGLMNIVADLNEEFEPEKRRFTLDGHLVGSLGEVIAAAAFDLELLPSSTQGHDAQTRTRPPKLIQIKLTGAKSVSLRSEPEHLIVLSLATGSITLVYNGEGRRVWQECGKLQTNGQRPIGLAKLVDLNSLASERLSQVRPFPPLP